MEVVSDFEKMLGGGGGMFGVKAFDSIQAAGFAINNPNAVSSCGCGHSFQVAEGEAPEDPAGCGSGCSH